MPTRDNHYTPFCWRHPKYKGVQAPKIRCLQCDMVYLKAQFAKLAIHLARVERELETEKEVTRAGYK